MTATIALPMYDFPELASAHDRLWRRAGAHARRGGLAGDLPLTQVCGYPLLTSLAGAYDVVAAPVYDVPFCAGSTHCGLIVVSARATYAGIEDLRNARFAVNALDSNTGSHAASLRAVAGGEADAASIDNVTFALLAENRPDAVADVRVIAGNGAESDATVRHPRVFD